MCLFEPPTSARTLWRLGRVRFLVLLLAWDTWFPTRGPLPHRSHLKAMLELRKRNAASCRQAPGKSSGADRLAAGEVDRLPGGGLGGEELPLEAEARVG